MKKLFFLAFAIIGLCSFDFVEKSEFDPVICGENSTIVDFDCGVACVSWTDATGDHALTFNQYLSAVSMLNETCPPSEGLYPAFDEIGN